MFFFQPGKMIKGSVVGTQRDGSQGSIWELENLDNTKVTSVSFNKSTNKPLKAPQKTQVISSPLCASAGRVMLLSKQLLHLVRDRVFYAAAGKSQFFYDFKNPS